MLKSISYFTLRSSIPAILKSLLDFPFIYDTMTLICYLLVLLSTVTSGSCLITRSNVLGYQSLPVLRIAIIFGALDVCEERNSTNLAKLLVSSKSVYLHRLYRRLSWGKERTKCFFDAYWPLQELHYLLLPLDLIFANQHMISWLDVHWDDYKSHIYEVYRYYAALKETRWRERIFEMAKALPSLAGSGKFREIAIETGPMDVSDFGPQMVDTVNYVDLQLLKESLPPLLYWIQAMILEDNAQISLPPEDDNWKTFYRFLQSPLETFKLILEEVKRTTSILSVLSLWHGKLIYLMTLLLQHNSNVYDIDTPKQIFTEYFTSYPPCHYQEDVLSSLTSCILSLGLFKDHPSLPVELEENLARIQRLHPFIKPIYGSRDDYLWHWRSIANIRMSLKPEQGIYTWEEVLRLCKCNGHQYSILPIEFLNVLLIRHNDGVAECFDIYCLLEIMPVVIQMESGLFTRTPAGYKIEVSQMRTKRNLKEGIALLITWGMYYLGKDIFGLLREIWDCFYLRSKGGRPNQRCLEYAQNEVLEAIQRHLDQMKFFEMTEEIC